MAVPLSMMHTMEARCVIRPDGQGYTIRDLWSGEPARLAGSPQVGLSQNDAEHTADLLNSASGTGAQGTGPQGTGVTELRQDP